MEATEVLSCLSKASRLQEVKRVTGSSAMLVNHLAAKRLSELAGVGAVGAWTAFALAPVARGSPAGPAVAP